jgi:uncharacterized damage-inducible protein DinB
MEELLAYRQLLLSRYVYIVGELEEALQQIPPAEWLAPLDEQGWSAQRVIVHLLDAETQCFTPFIECLLAEECRSLSGSLSISQPAGQEQPSMSLLSLLAELRNLRQQQASQLRVLPPEAWNRIARHPAVGLRTLQWWVEQSLVHCVQHFRQLSQYCREVSAV